MVYAGVLRSSKHTLHLATLHILDENNLGPPKLEIILVAPKCNIYFKSTIKLFYFNIAKVKLSIFISLLRVFESFFLYCFSFLYCSQWNYLSSKVVELSFSYRRNGKEKKIYCYCLKKREKEKLLFPR